MWLIWEDSRFSFLFRIPLALFKLFSSVLLQVNKSYSNRIRQVTTLSLLAAMTENH